MIKLGEICKLTRGPFGGSLKKEIFVKDGYKIYEQKNAIKNDLSIGDYFINEHKYQEMKRFAIKENDLIISCSGTIGKVAIIEKDFKEGIINQALLKITPNKSVKPKYLKLFFEFGINLDNRGSAIKNVVSVEELKKLELPLPSIEIQEAIIKECEEEIQYIKMTEKMIEKQKEKIDLKLKEIWIENRKIAF